MRRGSRPLATSPGKPADDRYLRACGMATSHAGTGGQPRAQNRVSRARYPMPSGQFADARIRQLARLNAWSLAMGLTSDTAQPRRISVLASRLMLRPGRCSSACSRDAGDRRRHPRRGETPWRTEQRTRWITWMSRPSVDVGRFTHNPEVAGSNPAPATRQNGLGSLISETVFCYLRPNSWSHPRPIAGRFARGSTVCGLSGIVTDTRSGRGRIQCAWHRERVEPQRRAGRCSCR